MLPLAVLLFATPLQARERPRIYDPKADAPALIAAAVERAHRNHQRVLLMWGGNWCGWCRKLHHTLESDAELRRELLYEYQLVPIDSNTNVELAVSYGADLQSSGVPYLTVLDDTGKVLVDQPTDPLETDNGHDPAKVLAFLEKWQAEARKAEDELGSALARAAKEHKRVLLHFGAPWCSWCHRLEDFLALPEVEAILDRDYVELKIDIDRDLGGKEMVRRFRGAQGGGIPWSVILDPTGKPLVDSDDDGSNFGYPVDPGEINAFQAMLEKTRRTMSDSELARLRALLETRAREILEARRSQPTPLRKEPSVPSEHDAAE